MTQPADFKSALQERLARGGTVVADEIVAEEGPPHQRTFEVVAMVDGEKLARGSGRLRRTPSRPRPRPPWKRLPAATCTGLDHLEGFNSFPDRMRLMFCPACR